VTRVIVVSGNDPAAAPGVEGGEASSATPATLQAWLTSGPYDIDALILDLAGPDAARAAVAEVRQHGLDVPVVLVAGDDVGWDAPDLLALPRCVVLPSPVDPHTLRAAVNGFRATTENGQRAAGSSLLPVGTSIPPLGERVTEYRVTRRARRGPRREERIASNGRPSFVPVPVDHPAADPGTTAQARDGPPPSPTTDAVLSQAPAPTPVQTESTFPVPISALALVRALLPRLSELDGVATTSDVIVKGAADRTGADGAVLLLPDDGRWRVAGGIGLRPVETRFQLPEDSWLVREIALRAQGAIIEDTDIARSRLRGAPLASWRHLMAAPVPRIGGLLLLARKSDPPFDEASLRELVEVTAEATPLLAAAVDVRSLARMLDGFRDQD
jgi:hypothetical protein